MKIALDTNVVVSGLLTPFGVPGRIVAAVAAGSIHLCHDARILLEYEEVLRRPKFGFPPHRVSWFLRQVDGEGVQVSGTEPWPRALPDPDDEVFLEVARAGAAEALVTGNLRHFPEKLRFGVHVMDPAEFWDLYRSAGSSQ